ncbi:Six-hairpin glycosidase-like protein [Labilithrix luteola]|uniref:Six-hairpin glycosidase-like protein n=1 Tax=Labilithrix luteola TaxID=1391654 RepID=A0A0K1PWK4_9BACT|nr:hypothetical protein [Labilithrix luteola]AKU97519.1 Six-hairpin glycosidase-like protein [Labilithrix luteola]
MRPSILLALTSLGGAVAIVTACSSSDDGAQSPSAPSAVDGGGTLGDEQSATGDGGGGFDGASTPACIVATFDGEPAGTRDVVDGTDHASVKVTGDGCLRSFEITSSAVRRDDVPTSPRTVAETADRPSVHTGSDLFDALYQLALDEAKENSVASIQDGAFRSGAPLACSPDGCFETGRKWTYVWTRDTSYAMNLGLAWVDAPRAASSLDFKLSPRRDGTNLQIVQDTGTGGSYPVSSDRVVWALGAREVLRHLSGDARTAFRDRAWSAIKNTITHDRAVVFDPSDGLYRGEQSFLDWREQTYPGWSNPNTVTIAESKSLSTNVTHLIILETGVALATEVGDTASAAELQSRADALRTAIASKFWLEDERQLSTFLPTTLDTAPARRFDLLGTSLAVLENVLPSDEARAAIANYPTLPKGPPVIFPQQQNTPIYHNRAIWPFVTAYWIKAARKVGNGAAFENGVASLLRGAALNLSNMENLEVVTGQPWVDDGPNSGPQVNSQRQLWSVGGFIGTVHGALFGVEATDKGLRVAPFVTHGLRSSLFPNATSIALNNLPFRGKRVSVVVRLPTDSGSAGAYSITKVSLNGVAVQGEIDEASLASRNLVEVELGAPSSAAQSVKTIADVSDYRVLFGPKTPSITGLSVTGSKVTLGIDVAGETGVSIDVYRDGVRIAKDLSGGTTSFQDPDSNGESTPGHCYAIDTRFISSGTSSQHSPAACFWGTGTPRISTLGVNDFTVSGGNKTTAYGRTFYEAWGDPGHQLAATFTATRSGAHLVQATYGNGSGAINTGITCAVKHVTIEELPGGGVVGEGYMIMPQRGDWASWGDSSFVRADLVAGKSYRIRLSHDDRAVNMSAFSHFDTYTGGTGGSAGQFFRVNVAELKVLALVP